MLTRQEMFDRAFIGLRSQGFQRCVDDTATCVYHGRNGTHCAWGWVDPDGTPHGNSGGGVLTLRVAHRGLAARLSEDDLEFAVDLQSVHDSGWARSTVQMEPRLRDFASKYNLTVPE